jgi:uroporphyrinogen III methyltransferase/synthase
LSGRVVLVGAGPGDPDLLTLRAAKEIRRAEVLLYDALIPPAIVELAPPSCERIDVGKRGGGTKGMAQDCIAALLCEKARAGRYVVRLKGGDPFVFGRGGEEASALAEAGIPFEVVPGVSAAIAVPAYAGIPVTDRRYSSSFAVVTGHRGGGAPGGSDRWDLLAKGADTLVVLMGTAWLEEIAARLIAGGRDPATPAAVIENGTTPRQRVVQGTLAEIAARAREAGVRSPTTIVVGPVVELREAIAWFERRPLQGRRVLLLRARPQQSETVDLLREAGAEVVAIPLLELAPPRDPRPLQHALARLPEYDWVLLTSANTVRHCAHELAARMAGAAPTGVRSAAAPQRPKIACIGRATAELAAAAGLCVDLVPESAGPQALLDALAACASLEGARLLLPRSESALDALPDALRSRGARVDCVPAYRNLLPADAAAHLREALDPPPDAALLTSPSTVERLAALLGSEALAHLAQRALLVCIGPSTESALRRWGVSRSITAEDASSAGMVAALSRYHAGRELP